MLLPWSVALAIMLQQQEKILTFIACANELVLLRLQQQQLQLLQLRLRLLLVLPVFPVPSTFVGRPFQFLYASLPHSLTTTQGGPNSPSLSGFSLAACYVLSQRHLVVLLKCEGHLM